MRHFWQVIIIAGFVLGTALSAAQANDIDLLSDFNDIYWMESNKQPAAAAKTAEPIVCSAPDDFGVGYLPPDKSGPFGLAAAVTGVAVTTAPQQRRGMIAIVIDDVGLDQKRAARTIALPSGVTLAFLPYAPNIQTQTETAHKKGHELMVHLPMAPSRMSANPGPNYLGTEHTAEELQKRIRANLDAFSGYVGVNNHMGSAFTTHRAGLVVLMKELKKRGVYFLDSKTAPDSIADTVAREAGIAATHRDVFLDHFETAEQVLAALEKTERVARVTGFAVAIGHPKDVTLDALEQWLPTLRAKGFDLVPLSALIKKRHAAQDAYVQASVPEVTAAATAVSTVSAPVVEEAAAAIPAAEPQPVNAPAATEKPTRGYIARQKFNR